MSRFIALHTPFARQNYKFFLWLNSMLSVTVNVKKFGIYLATTIYDNYESSFFQDFIYTAKKESLSKTNTSSRR